LPPSELSVPNDKIPVVKQSDHLAKTQDFKTLAEQAAKSSIFFKNYYVEELREKYKHHDRMKRIDKAFPYARIKDDSTGIVLIDEPVNETDLEICLQKSKLLKEIGYKYAIIEKDSSLFDVLAQLGAV